MSEFFCDNPKCQHHVRVPYDDYYGKKYRRYPVPLPISPVPDDCFTTEITEAHEFRHYNRQTGDFSLSTFCTTCSGVVEYLAPQL